MKKYLIAVLAVTVVLGVAWTAFGQPQGGAGAGQGPGGGGRGMGGRGGMNRDAQLKAIVAITEQVSKLKTLVESMPAMPAGGSFQDMSEDDRTKMRDAMTKIREEQPPIIAAIELQLAQIKGVRALVTANQEATAELKALQDMANGEKATKTAAKIGEIIAAKQKKLESDAKAIGVEPDRLQQMIERMGQGSRP